jgi:hypothetical protein
VEEDLVDLRRLELQAEGLQLRPSAARASRSPAAWSAVSQTVIA